eukprot:362973-Chlamydomonas_euryale.AAC.3
MPPHARFINQHEKAVQRAPPSGTLLYPPLVSADSFIRVLGELGAMRRRQDSSGIAAFAGGAFRTRPLWAPGTL